MTDKWLEGLATLTDVFFNGRSAPKPEPPKVTIQELVKRKSSTILFQGKLYRVEVREETRKDLNE